ncbi:hypothetical protein [Pyrococcus kukulkanii]|uniref:Uncharacterized protein n=1 Tax=Pyrococcus kukulkanii TaxID=1609559 RepID=A0ABV4T7L5_9EURY
MRKGFDKTSEYYRIVSEGKRIQERVVRILKDAGFQFEVERKLELPLGDCVLVGSADIVSEDLSAVIEVKSYFLSDNYSFDYALTQAALYKYALELELGKSFNAYVISEHADFTSDRVSRRCKKSGGVIEDVLGGDFVVCRVCEEDVERGIERVKRNIMIAEELMRDWRLLYDEDFLREFVDPRVCFGCMHMFRNCPAFQIAAGGLVKTKVHADLTLLVRNFSLPFASKLLEEYLETDALLL